MNRAERRQHGRTLAWEAKPTPRDLGLFQHGGWSGQFDRHFANGKYSVQIRTVQTSLGPIEHAAIRNSGGTDIPWREKQLIKNELFGPERVAVEVFPAESDLVDVAAMYHIWVLPPGSRLPFGLR